MQIAGETSRRDMREVSGSGRNQLGEQMGGRTTATEIGTIQQALDNKTGDYRNTVGEQVVELVRDAHAIVAGTPSTPGFWTDERVILMINQMGQTEPVRFRGTDLKGSYNFTVDVESAPPPTSGQIKAERASIYAALKDNERINQEYLIRWATEVFEGLDIERLLVPEEQYIAAKQQAMQAGVQMEAAGRQQEQQAAAAERQDKMDEKIQVAAVQGMGQVSIEGETGTETE